ncbi:MAG: FecR domain-containing protein, partial [Bacteroidota bacterium]
KKQFFELLDRYEKGQASEEDKILFNRFFYAFQNSNLEDWDLSTAERIRLEIYQNVKGAFVQQPRRIPLWQRTGFQVAASLVFIFSALFTVYKYSAHPFESKSFVTEPVPPGELRTVVLPDGSEVRIGPGSSLTYPEKFKNDLREVSLIGEAYFKVQPNKNTPFVVAAKGLKTTVLGTSFNINTHRAYETIVTLVEGKVAVTSREKEEILKPGEQLTLDRKTDRFTKRSVNTQLELAWLDGTLYFEDTPLDEVMATLGRWYNTEIVLVNDQLANCTIRGKFQEDQLVNVLEGIKFLTQIEYEISESKIVVTGEGCP